MMPEDAAHWIRVYLELYTTKVRMLDNLRALMEDQDPDAKAELVRSDVLLLEAQLQRFRRRLDYWERRQEELAEDEVASDA